MVVGINVGINPHDPFKGYAPLFGVGWCEDWVSIGEGLVRDW